MPISNLQSLVSSVTVFPDRARVTRSGRINLQPGLQRVEMADIPLSLLADSVRAGGRGAAKAKLLGVSTRLENYYETPIEAARELEAKIQAAEDADADLAARAAVLEKEQKSLDTLAAQSEMFARGLALRNRTTEEQGAIFDFITRRADNNQAELLKIAGSVIVVPGYGMAVAQAQHAVRDLADLLQKHGGSVRYAIHPVAGRMPGHMNVLLAEANVPYDQLYELEAINDEFQRTDVALVVGANDVVNPAAKNTPGSPIYGMPILNVDQSKAVIVLKRSMNPGFAGIENELFVQPNTMMVFGDAKQTLAKLSACLKDGA